MINELTITKAHEGLVNKEFSAVELTNSCLNRIKKVEPKIEALITVLSKDSIKSAKEVDDKIAKGEDIDLLAGLPAVFKDNMLVAGTITTGGSKILENYRATYNANVTEKLANKGLVLVGKGNQDEFSMGSSTENSAYKTTKTPWDTERVAGGTSGGPASAVAADECIYSLGSDTGGSIRQPASFCGVVGLKPTYGRVSRHGLMAMGSSLDQIGPITKNVSDSALLLSIIAGYDPKDFREA